MQSTLSAVLSAVRSPTDTAILQTETVHWEPLLAESVAVKSVEEHWKLLPPKLLLQTADGTLLLARNVDSRQCTRVGYCYSKSHPVRSILCPLATPRIQRSEILHLSAVTILGGSLLVVSIKPIDVSWRQNQQLIKHSPYRNLMIHIPNTTWTELGDGCRYNNFMIGYFIFP
jgi:hypothetical protein